MGDGINFDPLVAAHMREELTKSLEVIRKQATTFEGLAQSLEACWRDESANDVAELIRYGSCMYGSVAGQILEVQSHLDELERIYDMQEAAKAAARTAGQNRALGSMDNQKHQGISSNPDGHPNDQGYHASIGPDRYR